MLSRTLRHSRLVPFPRLQSLGHQQGWIARLHSAPSVSAAKAVDQAPSGTSLANGWREKTVVELKAELKRRGLSVTGKKEALVRRLTNANADVGIAEPFCTINVVSPTKPIKAKKLTTSLMTSTDHVYTTSTTAPPISNIPELYAAATVAPIPNVDTLSLTMSMSNLQIGTMPPSPVTPTPLNKGSFANLRAASTLTPPKSSSSSNISPKTSRNNLHRQNTASYTSSPIVSLNPSANQSQLRHASTIAPASVPTAKPSPKAQTFHSAPCSPSKIRQSPPKQHHLHTSKPVNTMLSDNVYLPTFTAEIPIEIPPVPILPTTKRAPPPIEIETPPTENSIITTAGAYTHPAPPGGGSDHTKQHLQSDFSKRRSVERESEKQDGRDWHAESDSTGNAFKFVPETGEIPASDKGILWGVLAAATLWGVFGPGKKDGRK